MTALGAILASWPLAAFTSTLSASDLPAVRVAVPPLKLMPWVAPNRVVVRITGAGPGGGGGAFPGPLAACAGALLPTIPPTTIKLRTAALTHFKVFRIESLQAV